MNNNLGFQDITSELSTVQGGASLVDTGGGAWAGARAGWDAFRNTPGSLGQRVVAGAGAAWNGYQGRLPAGANS